MRANVRWILAVTTLLAAGLSACSDTTPAPEPEIPTPCLAASTMCFGHPEYILRCADDGSGWAAGPCDEGTLCHEGSCKKLACVPDSRTCEGAAVVACSADGSGKLYPKACEQGYTCFDGGCVSRVCEPGAVRCRDAGVVERCEDNGTRWAASKACPAESACFEGICLPAGCTAGQTECGPTTLYTCDAAASWKSEPCPDERPCLFGRCVACVAHDTCGEGEICEEGACVATAPELQTELLPPGTVGAIYSERFAVAGGKPPYLWTVSDGALPDGVALGTAGELGGTPTAPGTATFRIKVEDANAKSDDRGYTLEIAPAGGALRVTTTTLPAAEHGLDYEFALQAAGGVAPYAWQVLEGALPVGLELGAGGKVIGVPDEIGTFPMTVRVLDGLTPPSYATKNLSLTVEIAPLSIVGEREYNLLLTKIIVLPTLIPFIPYSTQLEARGGLRPYNWSEEEAPAGLGWIIPTWGMPSGMSLNASGVASGWVTDVSEATQISIPFTSITLTGYFFYVKVSDSQNPAESVEAIFCLPTVPL